MFQFQKPYEKVEFILRPHWLVLLFEFLRFVILIIVGFFAYYLADVYFISSFSDLYKLAQFLLVLYILIIWQVFFRFLTDYYLDTWVVTDHRVIDIYQKGLFSRDISELRYSKIQDISVKINGLIPTFFNFGDLIIQTAGAVQEFEFIKIPKPNQVKDKILQIHDTYMKEHANDTEIHETSNTIV